MTDDQIDIDQHDEAEELSAPKVSLKDTWDSNPLLKLAAVVLVGAVLGGVYFTFIGSKKDPNENKSIVGSADSSTVKVVAGGDEVDAEYRTAIEEQNKARAEQAFSTGASAMPTPIGAPKAQGIDLPAAPTDNQEDPLKEWRSKNVASSNLGDEAFVPEQDPGLIEEEPEIVPLVQPVRPQVAAKVDPNAAKALAEQMRVIITAQAPQQAARAMNVTAKDSLYTEMVRQQREAARASSSGSGEAAARAATPAGEKVIVPAGSISYAQLLTELNSDVKGPALAQILSGPLEGGRALGSFSTQEEFLVITFTRIIKDGVSYSINGIALDENTTLAGHVTDVDHHYFTRMILPAAAAFIEGYGKAASEQGQEVTTTSGGGTATAIPEPGVREELWKGSEEASKKLSEFFDEKAERPITVKVAKGTTMGILFMDPVTTASAN